MAFGSEMALSQASNKSLFSGTLNTIPLRYPIIGQYIWISRFMTFCNQLVITSLFADAKEFSMFFFSESFLHKKRMGARQYTTAALSPGPSISIGIMSCRDC